MTRKLYFNQSCKYPFDLDKVLYAAQDFRWCKWDDDWHSGVLDGNLIHIRQVDNVLEYKPHSGTDLDDMLRTYFRLDDPIDDIYDELASRDAKIAILVKKHPWLRVLRQPDPWECMVAYICAAHSKIPSTIARVERIAERLGRGVALDEDMRHTFPSWEEVLDAGEGPLEELRLRFPNKHPAVIVAAAQRIRDERLNLRQLAQPEVSYGEAKLRLLPCSGISAKSADCIALFALDKTKAFPVDTWVRTAVREYFWDLELYDEAIVHWAQDYFGKYAGFANQFLFYEARENSR